MKHLNSFSNCINLVSKDMFSLLNCAMENSLTRCCVHYACRHTDISLFDELDNLGDADELLEALENAGYVSNSSFK